MNHCSKETKKWVNRMLEQNHAFFENLLREQRPPILWIGCADSRVPANEITGTKPGNVFVHRNIAKMVVHYDLSNGLIKDLGLTVKKDAEMHAVYQFLPDPNTQSGRFPVPV